VTRVKILACAAAFAASLSLASASSGDEAPDGWVYDAMAAPATVSYEGVVETVRIGNGGAEASVYRIEHRAPNQTVRQYTSPSRLAGSSTVTKGIDTFAIDATNRRVVQTRNAAINDQIAIDNNYMLMRRNYTATRRGYESFDGRDTIDVALVNNYTHRTTVLVRIDRETKLVLDRQLFGGDGSLVAETRFEQVRFAPSPPQSDFALPKDYAIVRGDDYGSPNDDPKAAVARAGFEAHSPTFLPDGFSPLEGSVTDVKGVRTLHLLYSDGLQTVSLFENRGASTLDMTGLHAQSTTISGRDATYAEKGPIVLLSWSDSSLSYELVGELRLDELSRIAASIAP